MTVIRPNSISGITSITAQANDINFFRSDGTLAALQINGINFNNTSGISTLAALNVTGNVSIAGTLTYEDVTNVDSIGIVTARSGVNVSGGQLDVGNNVKIGNAGIITATGLIATSYLSVGDDDTINVGDGNDLKIYHQASDNNSYIENDTGNLIIRADATNKDITLQAADALIFKAGGNERLHITSAGNVGIGTTDPENDIHIKTGSATMKLTSTSSTTSARLILESEDDSYGGVHFGDPSDEDAGRIRYYHGGSDPNHMQFSTAGSERVRIDSGGKLWVDRTHASATSGNHPALDIDTYANGTADATFATGIDFRVAGVHKKRMVVTNGSGTGGGDWIFYRDQGNNVGLRISSQGYVTKPVQPCAVVYQCTGPAGGNADGTGDNQEPLHFDHVHINQGGMTISQNNGRIEVPVTGIYFVSYMVSGTVQNVDTNDGIELLLLVNGNEYPATNSGAEPVFNFGHGHNNAVTTLENHTEYFCNNTLLVSLTGGDYVEVALDNIGSSDATVTRGNFNVMLMA